MNTRQIPGKDKIGSLAPGKYKTFEGTEIVAENCMKGKVKDLIVEGKTYQNLFKAELNQGHVIDNSSMYVTTRINSKAFTLNTKTYTIAVPNGYEVLVYKNLVQNNSVSITWANKIVWTNSSETNNIRIMIRKPDDSNITVDEVKGKIVLLEGDYTNIDILNSINGIESVTERENNVLSVKINDNTTTLNIPIPLRSLPNGTCDTIEGNKLVQRVGKVVLDGTETYSLWGNGLLDNTIGITTSNSLLNIVRADRVFYCDKLPVVSNLSVADDFEGITSSSNTYKMWTIKLSLNKLTEATLDKAVNYIKNNNITIYYPLAKPIIHNLEVPQLSTTKGTNIITCDNNIKPKLSMKVKVK